MRKRSWIVILASVLWILFLYNWYRDKVIQPYLHYRQPTVNAKCSASLVILGGGGDGLLEQTMQSVHDSELASLVSQKLVAWEDFDSDDGDASRRALAERYGFTLIDDFAHTDPLLRLIESADCENVLLLLEGFRVHVSGSSLRDIIAPYLAAVTSGEVHMARVTAPPYDLARADGLWTAVRGNEQHDYNGDHAGVCRQ
eukprot:EC726166.1.p1 GENE.EC726166.1~~EC726166.1.p1  ORF type:complete len:199 (+),score=21.92 EC726166.1:84-680(+)